MNTRDRQRRSGRLALCSCLLLGVIAGCGGSSNGEISAGSHKSEASSLSAKAALGKQLFFDVGMSASGRLSCASCHSPGHGFADPQGRAVSPGGPNGDLPGLRNAPGLTYASFTPARQVREDGAPERGGFFHDGRSPSLEHQAQQPFLTPFEMANADASEVLRRLRGRPYLVQFEALFGVTTGMPADTALQHVGEALAAFQKEDRAFHPFSSKFDRWQNGQAELSASELNGLQLFNSSTKGNCASCHTSLAVNGTPALFSNFSYEALGLPRNWRLLANQYGVSLPYVPNNGAGQGAPGYAYYDLGACGPLGSTVDAPTACGLFKVPGLRNVAITAPYFHNGVFGSLTEAVTWYVTRDLDAARWYRKADGITPDLRFNDLPSMHHDNVNLVTAPYGPRTTPALTTSEIADVVRFLCTLTDGYDPSNHSAYRVPRECQIDGT